MNYLIKNQQFLFDYMKKFIEFDWKMEPVEMQLDLIFFVLLLISVLFVIFSANNFWFFHLRMILCFLLIWKA